MSIQNTQVIIIRNVKEYNSVVEFMVENGISFQSGFDGAWEAQEIADQLSYTESNEWQGSDC